MDYRLQCEVKGHVAPGSMYLECVEPQCIFCGEWMSTTGVWYEADADDFKRTVEHNKVTGLWDIEDRQIANEETGDPIVFTFPTSEEAAAKRLELLSSEPEHWGYMFPNMYARISAYVGRMEYLTHEIHSMWHYGGKAEAEKLYAEHREYSQRLHKLMENVK